MQHDIIITIFCPKCFILENTNLKKKENFLGISILLLRGTKKTSFKLKPQGELARSFGKTMFLAEDRASVNVLRQDWAQDVWGTIEKDHFAGEKWIRSRGWVMGSIILWAQSICVFVCVCHSYTIALPSYPL